MKFYRNGSKGFFLLSLVELNEKGETFETRRQSLKKLGLATGRELFTTQKILLLSKTCTKGICQHTIPRVSSATEKDTKL